jgi:ribonucleoside-triphosphate reductase
MYDEHNKEKYPTVKCHDCGKSLSKHGYTLVYKDNSGKQITIYKCNGCFLRSKALKNYQECEVYSRIVGYLRPVSQWNKGKVSEFNDRKEFKV